MDAHAYTRTRTRIRIRIRTHTRVPHITYVVNPTAGKRRIASTSRRFHKERSPDMNGRTDERMINMTLRHITLRHIDRRHIDVAYIKITLRPTREQQPTTQHNATKRTHMVTLTLRTRALTRGKNAVRTDGSSHDEPSATTQRNHTSTQRTHTQSDNTCTQRHKPRSLDMQQADRQSYTLGYT